MALMAVPFLFIPRGGGDAGGHHRECHFPRLRFRVWPLSNLLFFRLLLEVVVHSKMSMVRAGGYCSWRGRQRGLCSREDYYYCCVDFGFASLLVKL